MAIIFGITTTLQPYIDHSYGKRQGTLKSDSEQRDEWRTLNRKKRTANCVLIHFIEINANFNIDHLFIQLKKVFVSCIVY